MKKILVVILMFIFGSLYAMDFKIDGSKIYYKQENKKVYSEYDFVYLRGCTNEHLKDGSPVLVFKDDSNIKKVVKDSYHEVLTIEKENSKWLLFYGNNSHCASYGIPIVRLIEPDLESEQYVRKYIKQIYP